MTYVIGTYAKLEELATLQRLSRLLDGTRLMLVPLLIRSTFNIFRLSCRFPETPSWKKKKKNQWK